ncbi:XrtV sorting system accessory protein [Blastomonas aquatica]|nr:XrtV sorting system accessory protein [Blastomonas aquatica]
METAFDWLSVAVFGAIALTYLHRSLILTIRPDPIIAYLPPVAACALANWLGNEGEGFAASGILLAAVIYYLLVLRPIDDFS